MTLQVTLPDSVYRQSVELAAYQQVSVERIVAATLARKMAGWGHVQQLARQADQTRFLAVLDQSLISNPLKKTVSERRGLRWRVRAKARRWLYTHDPLPLQ